MLFARQQTVTVTSLALAALASAQFSGWTEEGQVNASICTWRLPRAIVLRDTVYLDGGNLLWQIGMENGVYGQGSEPTPGGLIQTLNFTKKFDLTENQTALFENKPKASGAANNIAPNYVDGAMLGNYAQFFMYGGMTLPTNAYPDPDEDVVLEYQQYHYGGESAFAPGFINEKLPDGVTRYITYGAAVSAPSENKAWYFSGLRAGSGGVIYGNFIIPDAIPNNVSDTMIQLTFDDQSQNTETWENKTLPDDVLGRASPDGVFLPVGKNGVLVFVGGVTHPEFAAKSHKSENPAALKSDGEGFMKTIDIYNIADGKWYKQTTQSSETVPGRAQGCAVMSYAKDMSSFNIYYYGGYSAENQQDAYSDDVWVLSIPSFKWIKAKSGDADHGRAGHRCVMPYPDQMMVLGGAVPRVGSGLDCLKGGVIQLLNLTSLEWLESYDPEVYGSYGVPEVVQAEIGGGFEGGATQKEPVAGGWEEEGLKEIFDTEYDMTKINNSYPYAAAASTDRPDITPDEGGGGLPKWVAPTLGVVLGLVFITAIGVAFLFWRRRKILKRGSSVPSSEDNGRRILSWMRGQPSESKAMTVTTTEDTPPLHDMTETRSTPVIQAPTPAVLHNEAPDTQLFELPDSSPKPELHGAHLSPAEVVQRHFATPQVSNDPSAFSSSISGGDENSTISKASAVASAGRSPILPNEVNSPETPNIVNSSRVTSGVSGISDRDVGHLRQISEATVSDASEHGGGGMGRVPEGSEPPAANMTTQSAPEMVTPMSAAVSPPTAGERSGEDYITARSMPVSPGVGSTISPTRRSLFRENAEDMEDRR